MKIKKGTDGALPDQAERADRKSRAKKGEAGKAGQKKESKNFAALLKKGGEEVDSKVPPKAGRETAAPLEKPSAADGAPTEASPDAQLFSKELDSERLIGAQKDASVTEQRREGIKAQVESGVRIASDGTRDDQPIRQSIEGTLPGVEAAGSHPSQVGAAAENAPASPARAEELQKLINKMVEKVQVGEDARRRKTVILQVEVPGRGQVHVRLRKDGEAYDLRMRATDPSFAHALRSEQGELRRQGSEKGLRFARIEVVE